MSYTKQNFVSGQKLKAAQLNVIEDGIVALNDFYTDLSRTRQTVTVNCYGLTPGEEYEVHLYTASRRRGNAKGAWRHPSNTNTGVNFTGKGYARLAGQKYASSRNSETCYPEVPDWMPNGGILQTEWAFTAVESTEHVTIDLRRWLMPMLKPVGGQWERGCELIGIGVGANGDESHTTRASLLMRFKVVHKGTGEVGQTVDTLRVGRVSKVEMSVRGDANDGYAISGLYTSIK